MKKPLVLVALAALLCAGWFAVSPLDGDRSRPDVASAEGVASTTALRGAEVTLSATAPGARTEASDRAPAAPPAAESAPQLHALESRGISGVVIGQDGEPLPGAQVELVIQATGQMVATGVTGEGGTFDVGPPTRERAAIHDLRAGAAGYAAQGVASVKSGERYRIQLLRNDAAIFGRVLSSVDMRPIPGASVALSSDADLGHIRTTVTDSSGQFLLEGVSVGLSYVHASAAGYKSQGRPLVLSTSAPSAECSFTLDEFGSLIDLLVVDSDSKAPITGGMVRSLGGLELPLSATGQATLSWGPDFHSSSYIFVSAPGYSTTVATLDWSASRPTTRVVALSALMTYGLIISNPMDFDDWSGVFRQEAPGGGDSWHACVIEDDPDGSATVTLREGSREGGRVALHVHGSGVRYEHFAARAWDPATEARATLPTYRLTPGRTVRLRVVDRVSGEPIASMQCALYPADHAERETQNLHEGSRHARFRAQTTESSRVAFDGVGESAMHLYCWSDGYGGALIRNVASGEPGEQTIELSRMTDLGTLSGVIEASEKRPITITAIGRFGERHPAPVSSDGTFNISGLPRDHEYRVNIQYELDGVVSGANPRSSFQPDGAPISIGI